MTTDTRKAAIKKLDYFIKNGLNKYSSERNFDFGPDKRSNVSTLSPYLKRRIIHEKEVLRECLKFSKFEKIEKFIQEIFWRSYWKGWLEGRHELWRQYKHKLLELKQSHSFGIRKRITKML